MVNAFRAGLLPSETFADGVEVVRIIRALYKSAEMGRTIVFPDPDILEYVAPAARAMDGAGFLDPPQL